MENKGCIKHQEHINKIKLSQFLSSTTICLNSNETVTQMTNKFENIIKSTIQKSTVKHHSKSKLNSSIPWLDNEMIKLITHKNYWYQKHLADRTNTSIINELNFSSHSNKAEKTKTILRKPRNFN